MKQVDFVMIENFDKEKYSLYAAMSASERKSLPSTNFWRMKNGQEPIPVPEEDAYYSYYFSPPEEVTYVNTPRKKKRTEK